MSFDVADIRTVNGQLVIDTTGISLCYKHYNVSIEEDPKGVLKVTAEKPKTAASINTGTFDVNKITEESILEDYVWPWSKTKRRTSANIVEFKERTNRTYTTNNWQIITF